jgi:NitT/TauT family transport system substrate-binding protein
VTGKRLQIGFCSQFLCAPPYLTATSGEFFGREGLDVEIVYLRGSPSVIQALAGGALDYGASNFEDVLTATQKGVALTRFLSTANLPLAALAVAPSQAKAITSPKDLEGRTVGEVAAGGAAEGWTRNLMRRAGADASKVRFVALGPNIFDPVRLGLVDTAWVGEPSLTMLRREGAGVLVNFMEAQDATHYLGGKYAFMGISVRRAEADGRREEMLALGRAMNAALQALQQVPPDTAIRTLPPALIAGLDVALLSDVLLRYRADMYPPTARIDTDACKRAFDTLVSVGLVDADLDWRKTLDLSIVPS